jgi:hypothetical protein
MKDQNSELTPKQALAVFNFCNPQSPTFGDKGQAYLSAGYAKTKSYVQAATNLFGLPKVKEAVRQARIKFEDKMAQDAEISRAYALAQLQRVYNACFDNGRCIDRTNAVATVRLMMQKNSLLTDKSSVEHSFKGYAPSSGDAVAESERYRAEWLAKQAAKNATPILDQNTGGCTPGGEGEAGSGVDIY